MDIAAATNRLSTGGITPWHNLSSLRRGLGLLAGTNTACTSACYWLSYSTISLSMTGTFEFLHIIKPGLGASCIPPPATVAGVVTQVTSHSLFPERDKSLSLQGAFQPPDTLRHFPLAHRAHKHGRHFRDMSGIEPNDGIIHHASCHLTKCSAV